MLGKEVGEQIGERGGEGGCAGQEGEDEGGWMSSALPVGLWMTIQVVFDGVGDGGFKERQLQRDLKNGTFGEDGNDLETTN